MLFLATALLLQQPALPQKQLVVDLTIPNTGTQWEFDAIAAVVEGRGGIYISDWKAPSLYRFDRAGKFQAQIGRPGEGPGEYRRPISIGLRGDSLWLWEPGQQRVTFWDPSGKVARTTTLGGGGGGYGGAAVLRDGNIVVLPSWGSGHEGDGVADQPVRLFGPDGKSQRTIFTIPIDMRSMKVETGPEMFIIGAPPFSDAPLLATARNGDGLVRVDRATTGPAQFTVIRYNADGTERWRRAIPYDGVPFDRTIVDSVIRGYTNPTNPQAPKADEAKVRAALVIPPRAIPVLRVWLGEDGRVWLQRPVSVGQPPRYTVLTAAGAPEFEISLPPRVRLTGAEGDRAWGVASDDDDLQSVVRFRIVGK